MSVGLISILAPGALTPAGLSSLLRNLSSELLRRKRTRISADVSVIEVTGATGRSLHVVVIDATTTEGRTAIGLLSWLEYSLSNGRLELDVHSPARVEARA